MDWSNENVLEFIEFYKEEKILWDPRHPDHKKKHSINEAWVRIRFKLSWPTTVEDIKKKKDSLMAYYRQNINKIKKSLTSGASADEVHNTNWFAFSPLNSFLWPIYDDRPTANTQNTPITEVCEDEVITVPEEDSIPHLNYISKERKRMDISSENPRSKRKEPLEPVNGSINDEFKIFGKLIASKLRTIKNPNTRDILMTDMHYMVSRASMIDRMNQQNVLPQSPNQIHQSPLCSIFHSPQNQIYQPNYPTSSHPPQNQINEVPLHSMSSHNQVYQSQIYPPSSHLPLNGTNEVPLHSMSSQSSQNRVYQSPIPTSPSITPESSPTDFKTTYEFSYTTESGLLSDIPTTEYTKEETNR